MTLLTVTRLDGQNERMLLISGINITSRKNAESVGPLGECVESIWRILNFENRTSGHPMNTMR